MPSLGPLQLFALSVKPTSDGQIPTRSLTVAGTGRDLSPEAFPEAFPEVIPRFTDKRVGWGWKRKIWGGDVRRLLKGC
jgi:hypothetical protein